MSGLAARIALPILLLQAGIVYAQTPAPAPAAAPAPAVSTAKSANPAGVIDLMEGDVRVFDANQIRRSGVKLKDPVSEGDSVVTGADGELHLNMQDGGYVAVRPNTAMKIMQYRANGDADDTSVLGIVKGALRSVTGFIGKFNTRNTRIVTPTATIGIRGTDHETFVVEQGDASGEAGTYDKVNAGGTYIETPQGRTDVTPNHAGFAPKSGAPRVLDRVPGFFKPTKNERLIEGRHAQMQPKLQQLREQRQQQVHQREGGFPAAKAQTPAANKPALSAPEKGGKAIEPVNAKSTTPGHGLAERQQAKPGEMQQRMAQRKQAVAEQQQKRQAARQQAVAAQQKARQERMEAQKKAQQQKRRTPAQKEKEQ